MKIFKKNNLDERQELKLLKIEHNGCWLAFWGVFIAILIQSVLNNATAKDILGEVSVLICMIVYPLYGCIKNGIWDRRLQPTFKTNAIISVITGILLGVFESIVSYYKYNEISGAIVTGVFIFVSTSILAIVLLSILSAVYKKRIKKLEDVE
ncbi:DUF6773 family protein [uncultured Clostridium sp.]|uniref:DUF6773 family protein n=1 Tax=uncultured Clostridium sp. TaxID=59620 RepID=UPI0025E7CA05|nr:DUF6773 family protein [uncultured Clostridium sp.]